MEDDSPPLEAYSRVTNPERFAPLHQAAHQLLAKLESVYDVHTVDITDEVQLEPWGAKVLSAKRVTPLEGSGSPLLVALTPFPGVLVRFGHRGTASFPSCGCDACDEQVPDQTEELQELVGDLVEGYVSEELRRGPGTAELLMRRSDREGATYYYASEAEALGEPWHRFWGPWPRR